MDFLDEIDAAIARAREDADALPAVFGLLDSWLGTRPMDLFAILRARRPIPYVPPLAGQSGRAVVTKHADVVEVLSRESDFTVAPYTTKLRGVVQAFVLGMGDTEAYRREREALRAAMPADDVTRVRQLSADWADHFIGRAGGRLDVVDGLARRVATRVMAGYLGVPGPSDRILMAWARALFHHTFANLGNDTKVKARAAAAGAKLGEFIEASLPARRKAANSGSRPGDVFGRLLVSGDLDDGRVRDNLVGLLAAGIDSPATAMVNVVDELLRRPTQLEGARQAALAGDDELLAGYVDEALRFQPQNTFLVRLCERSATIAAGTERETALGPNTLVFAATASAMFDSEHVDEPLQFRVGRPAHSYVHFGEGMHVCLGRHLAQVMLLEVTRQLLWLPNLRREQGPEGQVQRAGWFPTRFVVEYGA